MTDNPIPSLPPWLALMQAEADRAEADTQERLASDIYTHEEEQ